jgi:hypothetical protein
MGLKEQAIRSRAVTQQQPAAGSACYLSIGWGVAGQAWGNGDCGDHVPGLSDERRACAGHVL